MSLDTSIWRLLRALGCDMFSNLPDDVLARVLTEFVDNVNEQDLVRRIKQVKIDRIKLEYLNSMPQVAQRSQEWFDLRKERLTASDLYKVLSESRSKDALVKSKAFPETARFTSSAATEWGKMFEPMALRVYRARRAGILVHDFGLIPHPTLSCFGASPDGITDLGVMIEIKCPYSREILPNHIPEHYEAQMQGQMAVCDLKECDYIECQLFKYDDVQEYLVAAKRVEHPHDHGVIIDDEYSPEGLSGAETLSWYQEKLKTTPNPIKVVMWTLGHIQVQRVTFDEDRWASSVPKIERFWQDVLTARKKRKNDVDFIDDDD